MHNLTAKGYLLSAVLFFSSFEAVVNALASEDPLGTVLSLFLWLVLPLSSLGLWRTVQGRKQCPLLLPQTSEILRRKGRLCFNAS